MKRMILAWLMICVMLLVPTAMAEGGAQEPGQWRNILLLGGDSRSDSEYGRTDTMIILSVNYDEGLMKMTSVMRDIWVDFPGTDKTHKINAANVYGGPELAMKTVNHYFGTDIEDYVLIRMEDLSYLVDLVGGVEVTVDEAEQEYINQLCPANPLYGTGYVHLTGDQALAYTRDRTTKADYGRVMRQQEVLLSMGSHLQEMDVNELMDKVDEMMNCVQTNMETEELKELATVGMIVEIDDVLQLRIPANGTYEETTEAGLAVLKPDFAKNATIIRDFIYFTNPEDVAEQN